MNTTEHMEQNDHIETIEIIDMGSEGEGIGKAEGLAVFVPGAITGDLAEIRITTQKKNFAKAELIRIVKPSRYRTKPFCRYAGECGGCNLQSMNYEGQLLLKQKMVRDRLERIGGIQDPKVHKVQGMKIPLRYRNKAQFPIQNGQVGFYKAKSHSLVSVYDCGIQAEPAEAIATALRKFIASDNLTSYDEKTGKGLLRHLIVKTGFQSGEVMAVLVCNGNGISNRDKLVDQLKKAVEQLPSTKTGLKYKLRSLILNVNRKKTSEILGQECITLYGQPVIKDQVGDLEVEISPLSFYQVNPHQMKRLYDLVLEYGGFTGQETVVDLYCGVGTIGLYCASKAKRVLGIETEKSAVLDANRNAVINGIVNAEFIHGKAEVELPKLLEEGIHPDVVLLDPPRAGCDPALLHAVVEAAPARIIYVSCDPATLARDVKLLVEGGYKFVEAQPVDMFPWTMHVECVIMMTNSGLKGK